MLKYVGKRLLAALVTLFIILTTVFVLMRQMPIEGYFDNIDKADQGVIDAKLHQLGLKDPMHIQLLNFYKNILKGDLGVSNRYRTGAPIIDIIAGKAPISIQMGLISMALSLLLGIPLGAKMARSKYKFWDKLAGFYRVYQCCASGSLLHIYSKLWLKYA